MRNITLDCPHCNAAGRAVGDPKEDDHGWNGTWYCFACGSSGKYQLDFTIIRASDPEL